MSKELIASLLGDSLLYRRSFKVVTGSASASILLCQCFYWQGKMDKKHADRWWYKSNSEWMEELAFTENELRGAKNKLLELGLIEVEKRGLPARNWYRLNYDRLYELLENSVKPTEPSTLKPQPPTGENHSTLGVESTALYTETTTETTAEEKEAHPAGTQWSAKKGTKKTSKKPSLTATEILEKFQDEEIVATEESVLEKYSGTLSKSKLGSLWVELIQVHFPDQGVLPKLTVKEVSQLHQALKPFVGTYTPQQMVSRLVGDWWSFTQRCEGQYGAFKSPERPGVGYLLKFNKGISGFMGGGAAKEGGGSIGQPLITDWDCN